MIDHDIAVSNNPAARKSRGCGWESHIERHGEALILHQPRHLSASSRLRIVNASRPKPSGFAEMSDAAHPSLNNIATTKAVNRRILLEMQAAQFEVDHINTRASDRRTMSGCRYRSVMPACRPAKPMIVGKMLRGAD